jgi:phage regulator Rha-like protein
MAKRITVPDEIIISKIFLIRGQKVMLDRDLAELYGVETRALKQAVRRNKDRFPGDFMFEMNKKEFESWRNENITSSEDKQGLRHTPFCFTEQGVTMLSCILNGSTAIEVNIRVIRIFTRLREMVLTHKDILLKLEQLERKVIRQDDDIKLIFDYLKELLNPPTEPMRKIGFKLPKED